MNQKKKFNILIQNKRNSFNETFYIHDKYIIKNTLEKLDIHYKNKVQLYPTIVSEQVAVFSFVIKFLSVEQTTTEEN